MALPNPLDNTQYKLKSSLRGLIFNGDPVLRQNLISGTQILHSKSYPTQVFNLKGTKYIRVNSSDIESLDDTELDDLLKLMLSTEDYSTRDESPPELTDILTDSVEHYLSQTGEDLRDSDLIDTDAYSNITDVSRIPLQPKVFSSTSPDEDSDDTSSDDDMTSSTKSMAESTGMVPEPSSATSSKSSKESVHVPDLMEVEQALEELKTISKKSTFHTQHSLLEKKEILALNAMTRKLLKAFKGSKSKEKRITPRKHISAKTLSTDTSEKIYIDHSAPTGKHIEFNLLIDMSGSMSGDPMKNAVSLIYLFNKLAQSGYVTGSIVYSSTSQHYACTMPISDAEVLSLNRATSSEGLADTIEAQKDILKNMNLICITDGDICDTPIKKDFWHKHRIVSTGVYINPRLKDVLDYTGKLDKWFNHSLVRASLEDMIQLLVKIGLKG